MANGKLKQESIDCDEAFSLVVKPTTIRDMLHFATTQNWHLHQLDVQNAFLHGDLKETVYMHQPLGFWEPNKSDHVCLLRRLLYGLKQAPCTWNARFTTYAHIGFIQSVSDPSLFVMSRGKDFAYLLLYIDDIMLTTSTTTLVQSIIKPLNRSVLCQILVIFLISLVF